MSLREREKKLLDKIEKAQAQLSHLQKKRKIEIGNLAFKYGLHEVEDQVLDQAFASLAKDLSSVNA